MHMERHENIQPLREIYLKEQFFEFILSDLKTLELRIAFPSFTKINKGDDIIFKSGDDRSIKVTITEIRKYDNLDDVLEHEDLTKLAPNMTKEKIIKTASNLFSESDIIKNGLILFEFKK